MEKIFVKSNIKGGKMTIAQPTSFDIIITSIETFSIGLFIGYIIRKIREKR